MGNIVDYVKEHGRFSFKERPFCKEDSLVLCALSYLKFDELMPSATAQRCLLREFKTSDQFDSLFICNKYEKENRDLFEKVSSSERFRSMSLSFYVNKIEEESGTQFSAVTMWLPTKICFVAFRGTDENLVGWREDLALALDRPIQGQRMSAEYLDQVAQITKQSFMVGGHSKGGNLAMYSAMNCKEQTKEKIEALYILDGPGFRPEVLEEYGFSQIKDKVVSIIPKSSYIGLLFATDINSTVVNAKSLGFSQHNLYKWVIRDGMLSETELTSQHKLLLNTVNEWVYAAKPEEMERFVYLLDGIIKATQAETTLDLAKDGFKYASNVIKASKDVDDSTKKFLIKFTKSYFDIAFGMVKDDVKERIEDNKKSKQ